VKPTVAAHRRTRPSRRGITLVEMLVTVAVLVLLMTILVQIFQAATGSLSSAQSYQELDNSLRRLDAMIREDLNGVTAKLTPPLNPKDGLGYFEYGENAFADLQGEDSDDYVRFTAKAPPGRPFRGRLLVNPPFDPSTMSAAQLSLYANNQPILITSEFAEIIYFLRNGNLYRRVFLIAPERQGSIVQMTGNTMLAAETGFGANVVFKPGAYGGNAAVSWQSMNDVSARPSPSGPTASGFSHIVLNSLGDLTNRENRAFSPRFSNDYVYFDKTAGAWAAGPDGIADDTNFAGLGDGVPDFYPTLYANTSNAFTPDLLNLIWPPSAPLLTGAGFSSMAFPYIYPGAYTQPETDSGFPQAGWIHSPTPDQTTAPFRSTAANALLYLQRLNHNPLDLGDNLYRPIAADGTFQTWWGFPTARETLSVGWLDPTWQPNLNGGLQAPGLNPRSPVNVNGGVLKVADDVELLPPMTSAWRTVPQPYTDEFGSASAIATNYGTVDTAGTTSLWGYAGEDDLIMTGVRSFDVKAYDELYAGYVDLGWKNDLRLGPDAVADGVNGNVPEFNLATDNTLAANFPATNTANNFLTGTPTKAYSPFAGSPGTEGATKALRPFVGARSLPTLSTFGHEGRMPPLSTDNRYDAQFPSGYYQNKPTYAQKANGVAIPDSANIGDDAPDINRLRRVFDTWSTDYTKAPAHALDPSTGTVYGPPFTPPVYPSYPPPYPAPLKGIQIQIRVADPTNQRIKQVTIRHDFSDRL
jgi:type II secretory pathway pseudopilin PulG